MVPPCPSPHLQRVKDNGMWKEGKGEEEEASCPAGSLAKFEVEE